MQPVDKFVIPCIELNLRQVFLSVSIIRKIKFIFHKQFFHDAYTFIAVTDEISMKNLSNCMERPFCNIVDTTFDMNVPHLVVMPTYRHYIEVSM